MNPVTVLYLDHTGKLGGAEVAIARLMGSLDRTRFRPIAVFADGGAAPEMVRAQDVETHIIPLDGKVREVKKDSLGFLAFLNPGRFFTFFTYASCVSYRSSIESRGSPLAILSAFVCAKSSFCPAASQPSPAAGPARSAQPVYVAVGTATSTIRIPAISFPS